MHPAQAAVGYLGWSPTGHWVLVCCLLCGLLSAVRCLLALRPSRMQSRANVIADVILSLKDAGLMLTLNKSNNIEISCAAIEPLIEACQ